MLSIKKYKRQIFRSCRQIFRRKNKLGSKLPNQFNTVAYWRKNYKHVKNRNFTEVNIKLNGSDDVRFIAKYPSVLGWANPPPRKILTGLDLLFLSAKVKNVLRNIPNIENMDIACFADDADVFIKEIMNSKANKVVCFSLDKKINPFKIEESNQIGIVTNNKNELVANGPFDIIICYDFLEHTGESPENWLSFMKNIRKTNGPIYLRAHPFNSRYHDHNLANKAYSHLVFTDSEKLKIGCPSGKKPCKELLTENEYFKLFYSLELSIIERNIIDHPIEESFINSSMLSERIKATLNKEMLFAEELSFEYIDYLLA